MATSKPSGLGTIHKILMFLIIINIIGDVGNVAFWWGIPSSRLSLTPSFIGTTAGANTALFVGSVILLIVAVAYVVGLFGLFRRMKWAPLLVITISVANRALAFVLYQISVYVLIWVIWTVILVVIAYLDWRKMKSLP